MSGIWQEIRFGLRQMRKSPGFTVTVVLTLALGIGAATSVFSLVDTVLLRPLPFADPERLMALDTLSLARGGGNSGATMADETSYPNFFDWREQSKSFEVMASYAGAAFSLGAGEHTPARRMAGMVVSSDFFRVLGVAPVLGRGFVRSEEQAGSRSVVISDGLWRSVFAGRPDAVGKSIRLNEESFTVIGVMPQGFQFPGYASTALWVPPSGTMEGKNPSGMQRGWSQLDVIGRLKAGVTVEQAGSEMTAIQKGLSVRYPDDDKKQIGVRVIPEDVKVVGDARKPLRILFGAVSFLLLMACVNVAGLLLTRSSARGAELAVRSALGATRIALVRQMLVESVTMSAMGGMFGVALASLALKLAPRFLPENLPRVTELAMDGRVLGFAIAASVVTGLVFGVLPAWRMSRLDPATALRDGGRSTTSGKGQQRLHGALVVGETAIGLVLLVGAGLLIRSFDRLMSVDPGFSPQHVLTFRVAMPGGRYKDEKTMQFVQSLQERMAAVPGVKGLTYAFPLPLTGGDMHISFSIDGRPTMPGDEPSARVSTVASNFFQTMKIPLLKGRYFTAAEDQPKGPPVMIVNQAFADKFFPGEEVLGKRIKSDLSNDDPAPWAEIVGVTGNVTRIGVSESAQPEYYLPYAHATLRGPSFAMRVDKDPTAYLDTVRTLVAEQDAAVPVYATSTYTELVAQNTAQQRFQTILLTGFAAIALLLAAIGLYAVLSYMVGQRTMELGLRLALGAQRSDVLSLVLRRGLLLAGCGLAIGLVASFGLTRYMTSLLFSTKALDTVTFCGMTALLFVVAAASCLVPSYRASRLNPNDTLRQQ
ncbi:duplicated orphan permease [Granulicella pectinivorans]|uniref:Duplicated orphan permease n=1 Tax=Granulicella pectinivorans TaxID=474950 RepID=A0A1I6MXZ0_9BACT|nr:ABC transporter permease [Granulicella pectinivorans]SFS20570.1 duplicated orphan permease [Granulicella pectinivorans]